MPDAVKIGDKFVGEGHPAYLVAEIGLNHNGSVDTAKRLIDVAILAGCDAVKFQKRTPELAVPPEMRNVMRETPWGTMTTSITDLVEVGDASIRRSMSNAWKDRYLVCVSVGRAVGRCSREVRLPAQDSRALKASDRATREPDRRTLSVEGMSTIEPIERLQAARPRKTTAHTPEPIPFPAERHFARSSAAREMEPTGYSGTRSALQTPTPPSAGACFRDGTSPRSAMWGSDHGALVEQQV